MLPDEGGNMAHLLDDSYLKPFEAAIRGRAKRAADRALELTEGRQSLSDWANEIGRAHV